MILDVSQATAACMVEAMQAKALIYRVGGDLYGASRCQYTGWRVWKLGEAEPRYFYVDESLNWCSCGGNCYHLRALLFSTADIPFDGKSYWKKRSKKVKR